MKPTREEKLRQLRRVVEAAPDDRLHMKRFAGRAKCGTVYCAAGWAAIDPWFQQNTTIESILWVSKWTGELQVGNPTSRELGKIFGINTADARVLFACVVSHAIEELLCDDPHAITKTDVLYNIDRLIRGEPAILYGQTAEVAR